MGLGTVLAGASLLGGLLKGVGGFFQEKEKETVAEFNKKITEQNIQIVQENAAQTASLISRQDHFNQQRLITDFAGRGVRVEGGPLSVLMTSCREFMDYP